MDGANSRTIGRPGMAAVASADWHLPIGMSLGARTADMAETTGHRAVGVSRGDLLPRPFAAIVHPRCPRVGFDLSTLRRFRRALRGDPARTAAPYSILGEPICTRPCRGSLGRRQAPGTEQLRRC